MKKYVKPDVAFEGFELSQHIAGGCTVMFDFSSVENCETNGKGFDIQAGFFTSPNLDCTLDWGSDWQDFCKYTNTGDLVFFHS